MQKLKPKLGYVVDTNILILYTNHTSSQYFNIHDSQDYIKKKGPILPDILLH